jgi:hypothetical protein
MMLHKIETGRESLTYPQSTELGERRRGSDKVRVRGGNQVPYQRVNPPTLPLLVRKAVFFGHGFSTADVRRLPQMNMEAEAIIYERLDTDSGQPYCDNIYNPHTKTKLRVILNLLRNALGEEAEAMTSHLSRL